MTSTLTSFVISTEEVNMNRQTKASIGKKKDLEFGYETFKLLIGFLAEVLSN